jgi:hypothetical protein
MFIAHIALGIASGIAAAAGALVYGSGILTALAAYILGGLAGVTAAVLWTCLPQRPAKQPAKRPITQRS